VKPVIQLERTGCGIAVAAANVGVSYGKARRMASSMGITASDRRLWSNKDYVRRLLLRFGYRTAASKQPFRTWASLPPRALLAIKWRRHAGRACWHWVVFERKSGKGYVLDSKKALRHHVRTDFWRMKPRWYIAVAQKAARSHDTY